MVLFIYICHIYGCNALLRDVILYRKKIIHDYIQF